MKYKDRVELDKEYGLFKFKIPTKEEREEALGLTGETIMFKKLISSGINQFYTPISAPNKENNSWLLSHKEFGQTYTEFMRTNAYYQIKTNANIIYLVNLIFYSEEDRENEKKYEEEKEKNPEVVKPTLKYMFKEQKDKMFNDLLIQFCEAYFNDMTIKIEDNISDIVAISLVKEVIEQGKISNNGTSYCYLTLFGNICVQTMLYRKTPCFRVYKTEMK